MSLAELKNNVLALPEPERQDLKVWLNHLEMNSKDVPGEASVNFTGLARLLEKDPLKLTPEQFHASMEADLFEQ